MKKYYLSDRTVFEPLLWNWYAWNYLVSPVSGSCLLQNSYLEILRSYLKDPDTHKEAMKDSRLRAGPFLNGEYCDHHEIEKLLYNTEQEYAHILALSAAIKEIDIVIHNDCCGQSMVDFYKSIPTLYRGLIELVYDSYNNPSLKILEPMMYSKFTKNHSHHSCHFQSVNINNDRALIMNTPRLKCENTQSFNIKVSFADDRLDKIFKTRIEAKPLDDILELILKDSNLVEADALKYFKEEDIRYTDNKNSNKDMIQGDVRIRYFGHACVLLQTKTNSILIDPCFNYHQELDAFSYYDLPESIDFVLVTHAHQDHFSYEYLLQLRHKIKTIVVPDNNTGCLYDPSMKLTLLELGFDNVIALKEFEQIAVSNGLIVGLPFWGEHSDLNIYSKLSFYINLNDKKFLFVADSNNFEPKLYENIFSEIDKVDYLFVGLESEGAPMSWVYGPFLTKMPEHQHNIARRTNGSNAEKAISLAKLCGCSHAYVYAMGLEKWIGHIIPLDYDPNSKQLLEVKKFKSLCKENNIIFKQMYNKHEEEIYVNKNK